VVTAYAVETAASALKGAKDDVTPGRGGLLGFFDKVSLPNAGDVSGVVSDAASSAKDSLPNAGK
jgi:hypothetical protein